MTMTRLHALALTALTMLFASPAMAAQCEAQIDSTDQMKFSKTSMEVPADCKQFTVKLVHTGKLPKAAMGHNWVLAKTSDMQAIATDAIKAGVANDYIKKDDSRVIAHTKLLGGGESDSVTFDTSKLAAGGDYTFFCSFPGHSSLMKGTLKLAK